MPLGKSSSLLDNVHMKLKNGETKEVLFLYDNAAESSVLSTTLMPYLEECTPVTWNCHTVSSTEIVHGFWGKITMGLFPYYIISYNKQGSFQMIIDDYNKGPRVVRKDYVL